MLKQVSHVAKFRSLLIMGRAVFHEKAVKKEVETSPRFYSKLSWHKHFNPFKIMRKYEYEKILSKKGLLRSSINYVSNMFFFYQKSKDIGSMET